VTEQSKRPFSWKEQMYKKTFSWLTKTTSLFFFILAVIIGIILFSDQSLTNSTGAPPGYTGSPTDGNDCSACHPHSNGMPDTVSWISTDVPPYGFDHTMMYNFTVNIPDTGIKGFEITVEDQSGNQMGYFSSGTNSQIVGTGKYITHVSPDTNNPGTWIFQWYPGSPGYGNAKVYGAFTVDSNEVYRQEMTLTEEPCTFCHDGIPSFYNSNLQLNSYCSGGNLHVFWNAWFDAKAEITLYSLNGERIFNTANISQHAGMNYYNFSSGEINRGIYFIVLSLGDSAISTKVFISK
jgi:hypothetical protein